MNTRVFLRKMLDTWNGPIGTRFLCSRDPILSDFRDPMIIFADFRDPNRVPKTLKKTLVNTKTIGRILSQTDKNFVPSSLKLAEMFYGVRGLLNNLVIILKLILP